MSKIAHSWRALKKWDQALTARLTLSSAPGANPAWQPLSTVIAHSGDSVLWLVGASLACVFGKGNWQEGGRLVFLATFVGGGAIWLLKQLFRRQRPSNERQGLYLGLDIHSFPSGHAGRNACSVVLLSPLLAPPLQVGFFVWLCLLGLSRVALGIHYVSDVLAGYAIGGIIGLLMR